MNRLFILCLTILSLLKINAFSQTIVTGGDVKGTWKSTDSPFLVQDNITIPDSSTLIIEPGVKVEFQGHYFLNVQGQLLAEGTENDSILFTVNDTTGFSLRDTTLGGWNGIQLIDTPTNNDTSKIVYCILQYGKAVGSELPNKAGGAIYISNFGKLLVSNCLISHNSAGGSDSPSGGGLCLIFADITLTNNKISHNHAWDGGGIQIWESDPVFTDNQIIDNTADVGGGGIWIGGLSDIQFNGDIISNNTAGTSGGGIVCWQTSKTTLHSVLLKNNLARWGGGIGLIDCELQADSCHFVENGSSELGGGLSSNFSKIYISNTNFERDTASVLGGAMGIYNSELSVKSSNLIDNMARILGGGIHSDFSTIILEDTKLEGDSAGNSGGGLFICKGDLEINNGLFNNNKSKYSGGAIFTDSTAMTINNSAFAQNTATDNGGAIFLNLSTATSIINTSFERNNAIWGGGILSGYGGLNLKDCSFTENSSEHGGAVNFGFGEGEFKNVSFLKNAGIWGGGITAANCDLNIDSCLFSQNTAASEGGAIEYLVDTAIFNRNYKFTLYNNDFIENTASYRSGAVRIEQTQSDFSMVDLVVDSCQFSENHAYAHGSLRIAGYIEDFVLSNSVFKSNTAERNTGGPGFMGNAKGEVYNCVFYSNYALFTDTTKTAHGASLQTEAEVDIINCTFTDTSSANGYAVSGRRGAKANLTNCILWGCGDNPVILTTTAAGPGCTFSVNYCDIEYGKDSLSISDSLSVINWGEGNINADPLFVDVENADLHLRDSSPCIGSGKGSFIFNEQWITAPVKDIEGIPRPSPQDSEVDMGAYEHELGIPVSSRVISDEETTLYQNYPNPISNSTTFKYHLSTPCYIELNIYNVFGQKIESLVAEKQSAGTYSLEWNVSQYNNGQYICQLLTSTGFMQVRKMIILK